VSVNNVPEMREWLNQTTLI